MSEDDIPKIENLVNKAVMELKLAEKLIQEDGFNAAVSRTYYAMFYAVQALFMNESIVTSSHHGLVSMFSKNFINTGIFPVKIGKSLTKAFEMRQSSDYNFDFFMPPDLAISILNSGKEFVKTIFEYIEKKKNKA